MESREDRECVRFSKEAKIITVLVGVALAVWLLAHVSHVLGPFLWGAITAYVFSPLIDWLEDRTHLRRGLLVAILYLLALATVSWAATVLIPLLIEQLQGLVVDAPKILTGLLDRLAFLDQYLLAQQIRIYGFTIDPQVVANEVVRNLQNLVGYMTRGAIPAVFNVLEGVGQVALYLIATFYLLRGWRSLRAGLGRLLPSPYRDEASDLLGEIDRVLGAYIRGQLLLIGIMAAATFIALSILQVRYSLVIAVISGVLEVIPLFGPIMAGGIAVSVALFQPATAFGWSNLNLALVVALAYVVLRQIEDQVVVPNLVGPIVDLHPLLVLFALFAGGSLAGFTGMVVAVPAAAALKIIVRYFRSKVWEEDAANVSADTGGAGPPPEPPVATEPPTTAGEMT